MPKNPVFKKIERKPLSIKNRFVVRPRKKWKTVKTANVSKIRPGDMILTINKRHTFGGFFSRSVAKLGEGNFAHVAACVKIDSSGHIINDFKGRFGHREMSFDKLAKTGVSFKVLRWKNIGPDQLEAFIHNLSVIPKIGNKYDFLQTSYYLARIAYKKATGREIPEKLMVDFKKRFTCSEYISTAAMPTPKEVFAHGLKMPRPKLEFLPGVNREFITPAMMEAAINAGVLEVVTEQTWEKS